MSTQRFAIQIPAAWAGLLTFGALNKTESGRWIDALGREAQEGVAPAIDDGRPFLNDERRLTVTHDNVEIVYALVLRHDRDWDGADEHPDTLPYGFWVEATRDGQELDLDGDLDLFQQIRYRDEVGDIRIDVALTWPPHLRNAAIDTIKRIWGVTKPVAARFVDTGRTSLLPARDGRLLPRAIIGGIACGHQVIDAVVPFIYEELERLSPDDEVRVMFPERMTLMASVRGDDGQRYASGMLTPHDWSRVIIGGQSVPTGLPVGGGPDPRRIGRAAARLILSHPDAAQSPMSMGVHAFAELTPWN